MTIVFDLDLQHTVDMTDTGLYAVCFRETAAGSWEPIPSHTGSRYLEVLKIPQDRTRPRGIFRNQYFTALAGSSTLITVAGSRIVTPTKSKIVLNAHASGTCGDNTKFQLAPGTTPAATDLISPQFMPYDTVPSHGTTVSQSLTVSLAFSEDVLPGSGSFIFTPKGTMDPADPGSVTVRADNPFIFYRGNRVIICPKRAAGTDVMLTVDDLSIDQWRSGTDLALGTYYLRTSGYGVVTDTATPANLLPQLDTGSTWEFTTAGAGITVKPEVLFTYPMPHAVVTDMGSPISLHFSEHVQFQSGANFTVTDCGLDRDCSTTADNFPHLIPITEFDAEVECADTTATTFTWNGVGNGLAAFPATTAQGSPAYYLRVSDVAGITFSPASNFQQLAACRAVIPQRFIDTNGDPSFAFMSFTAAPGSPTVLTTLAGFHQFQDGDYVFAPAIGAEKYRVTRVSSRSLSLEVDTTAQGAQFNVGLELVSPFGLNRELETAQGLAAGVDYGYLQYYSPYSMGFKMNSRYRVTFPAGTVASVAPDETRWNDEYSWEFDTSNNAGFQYEYVFHPEASSTSEGVVFTVTLPMDFTEANADTARPSGVFKYAVCFCDEHRDAATVDAVEDSNGLSGAAGFGAGLMFVASEERKMPAGNFLDTARMVSGTDDLCSAKCDRGCVGASCFCDGNDRTHASIANAFCLSAARCQALCLTHTSDNDTWDPTTHDECVGIDVHQEKNMCFLLKNPGLAITEVAAGSPTQITIGAHAIVVGDDVSIAGLLGGFNQDTIITLNRVHTVTAVDGTSISVAVDSSGETGTAGVTYGEVTKVIPLEIDESYIHFTVTHGAPCTHASDFTEHAGTVSVTRRVQIGVDYVLEPGAEASLEVAYFPNTARDGATMSLTSGPMQDPTSPAASAGLSRDRVTVVDCGGSCGVSSPSSSAVPAEGTQAGDIAAWNLLWAVNYFVDAPHVDSENPMGNATMAVASGTVNTYVVARTESFCSNNINLTDVEVVIAGMNRSLEVQQCYRKCAESAPCVGDDCFCGGHFSGYDGPDSNALCLSEEMLRYYCDRIPECRSYDYHTGAGVTRGFLNTGECESNQDLIIADPNYKLVVKQEDVVDAGGDAGTTSVLPDGARPNVLRSELDYAFSWSQLLRYRGVTFTTGGTFKLCFCDSASLGGASCGALADYGVEVGQIHVSGVACLLQNPKFRKSVCCRQYWPLPVESNGRTGTRGTYRCYKNLRSCPSFTITQPMDIVTTTPALVQPTSSTGMLATWCIFGPEEITQLEPNCQLVAGYQSVS
mmetsp:Transcript_6707/g.15096  ORF Transcript_6707/g.15096 Transcript_6707/m.15096 type:complete len:1288 (-) Transcript_6707:69-3932(-)